MKENNLIRTVFGIFLLIISLPFVIVYVVGYGLYGLLLILLIWLRWIPRGKTILLVTSDSPIWQTYMDTEIISPLESRAVILNWSTRSTWKRGPDLAIMAFRYFGGSQEFNPLAVVFKPLRIPKVFRFWLPFKDHKHGDSARLEQLKTELMKYTERY